MKPVYAHLTGALALTFAIAACVPAAEPPQAATPTPTPAPVSTPTPTPTPVALAPSYDNYLDAPQTPGDWQYSEVQSGSQAIFGEGNASDRTFVLGCNEASRQVTLARRSNSSIARQARIRTETTERVLRMQPGEMSPSALQVSIAAGDPLLDAMAITKGRFAIETEGMPTLYIPAWPEISRVIEDCR